MARIEGITIEIDGNTKKLSEALKGVNSQIYELNTDLKNLNQALKLDPKNTELLAQKQDVLKRAIGESTEKLETLKKAQQQMGEYNSLTDKQKSSYNALSLEIAKTEKAIANMNNELKNSSKIDLSGLKDGLKKVGDVALDVSKKLLQVSAAVGTALTGVVAASVKSYASLEQNLGGIETLFKDDADLVIENAKNAFKTAGVSANEYMQGVASFSASLLQSVAGDTQYAADIADMAFRDMSDNANKFGTDMSSIQSAYQGFAKQNYTMLDNLKLGYGGTKTEMERLLKDAQRIKKEADGIDIKFDINKLSDVYEAIHVIQEEMGVAGTTAEEAEQTISGSFTSMQAALDNFLNGSGSPEQLAESVINVLTNIAGAIETLAPNILTGVVSLIEQITPKLVNIIMGLLPQLISAVSNLIKSLYTYVVGDKEGLKNTISELVQQIITFLTDNLPLIVEMAIELLMTFCETLIDNLPMIIDSAITILMSIIDTITDNLDEIVMLAIDLVITLAMGIVDAIPKLVEKLPDIIIAIVDALTQPDMLEKLIKAAIQLMIALAKGLIEGIPKLIAKIPEIISHLVDGFENFLQDILDIGKWIVEGIWDGINGAYDWIKNKIKGWVGNVMDFIKRLFGIGSPSKLMRDEVGVWLAEGIGVGFTEDMKKVEKEMGDAIPKTFDLDVKTNVNEIGNIASQINEATKAINTGIETSLNPTINPNITLETNYQLMARAMKEAMKDMEIELDDRELGKFVEKTVAQEIYS